MAGAIHADNARLARTKLRQGGIFPTAVRPAGDAAHARGGGRPSQRVTLDDTILLTRQWATLLSAGVPLMEALSALTEQVATAATKKVCGDVREGVREGLSVAASLERHPGVFPLLYRQMVRAGEASGTLERILVRLADHLEAQARLKNHLFSILAYPVLMLVLSLLILIFIVAFVVPKVTAIFAEMNQALPLPTVVLLAVSHFFVRWGGVLALGGGAGFFLLRRWRKTPRGRARYDRLILRIPLIGNVIKMISISRCTKTLATLLSGGVPLLAALDIARQVVGNHALEEAMGAARDDIREGEGLAGPLKRSGLFPPLAVYMIATGEKTGHLEPMLEKVSESYDREVETAVTRATALLSPLLILGLGLVVFFIVLAVLLPIFEISQGIR